MAPKKKLPDMAAAGAEMHSVIVSEAKVSAAALKIAKVLKKHAPSIQRAPEVDSAFVLIGLLALFRAGMPVATLVSHFQWVMHLALDRHISMLIEIVEDEATKPEARQSAQRELTFRIQEHEAVQEMVTTSGILEPPSEQDIARAMEAALNDRFGRTTPRKPTLH